MNNALRTERTLRRRGRPAIFAAVCCAAALVLATPLLAQGPSPQGQMGQVMGGQNQEEHQGMMGEQGQMPDQMREHYEQMQQWMDDYYRTMSLRDFGFLPLRLERPQPGEVALPGQHHQAVAPVDRRVRLGHDLHLVAAAGGAAADE